MSPCPSGSTPSPGPRLGTNVAASPPALMPRRVPGGCQQSPVETLIIVWCLLQQPPDPTTQQPTQPVPSPWTQGQGHPKTAHLPLEGPAWALPTLPPPPPCFWEPTPSPPIWKVDTAWSRHSACMLGMRGWRGTAASPTCGLIGLDGASAWPRVAGRMGRPLPDTTLRNLEDLCAEGPVATEEPPGWESVGAGCLSQGLAPGLQDKAPAPREAGHGPGSGRLP